MRWRAFGNAIVRGALAGSPGQRVIVAIILGLLLLWFGPAMCARAPLGRTIGGVERRLDRDLPIGTSVDSVVAYLNRKGVCYAMSGTPAEILGTEEGVLPQSFCDGNIVFRILFDADNRVLGDSVYKEVICL